MYYLILAIIGLFVGVAGGMFGIGGGIVLIPALTEFRGPDQHLYQATAMITNLFVAIPAIVQHMRARALDARTIFRLMPVSILFVTLGVAMSEIRWFGGEGEAWLRGVFGLFLLACAATELYRAAWPRPTIGVMEGANPSRLRWPTVLGIAAPTGFSSGFLGIGGGILAVPLQRRFLGISLPIAIANSAALVAGTAFVGAICKNYAFFGEHGSVRKPLLLAAVLTPTAVAGSLLGARFTHRSSLRLLRNLFVMLLIIASIRLIYGAARALHG